MSGNETSQHKIKVISPALPKGGGDLKGMGETFTGVADDGNAIRHLQ